MDFGVGTILLNRVNYWLVNFQFMFLYNYFVFENSECFRRSWLPINLIELKGFGAKLSLNFVNSIVPCCIEKSQTIELETL